MTTKRRRPTAVVVGASAAGLTTVEGLRRTGYPGRIVLVGDEPHLPYDRPPLSKKHLTADPADIVHLRDPATYDELDVDVRLGVRAIGLDRSARTVQLDDGRGLPYDHLVIATGVRPRRLSQGHELTGVHTLRTVDDSSRIRAALREASRLVVVGGGFLGAELVASARTLGVEVTWLFPEAVPMGEVLGAEVGGVLAGRHLDEGVDLRTGVLVDRLVGTAGAVTAVVDRAGLAHAADLVVVCIGSVPNTEWLADSGLRLTNGVDCDEYCRAAPDVFSAGDVASWLHPELGARVRIEHRLNASEQALVVAHNVVHGPERAFSPVPYFWSDQYDTRLQAYGFPHLGEEFSVTDGSLADRRFAGIWIAHGEAVAVGGMGMPRAVRELRSRLVRSAAPVA